MGSKKSRKKIRNTVVLLAIVVAIAALVFVAHYGKSKDKIAATVNGEVILKEDVLREYINVPPEYRQIITVDSIVRGMIIEKLLLQEAEKMGIRATDEEVDEFMQELLDAYGITEENLTKSLEENGITLVELKNSFRERLTMNKLLNYTVLSEITVSDKEVRDYYNQNIDQFTVPEQVRASHILVNTSAEAKSIRNKALGGSDFGELAEEYSTCPSSANGGDLGWFGRGQMVKEFEDAAFNLDVGEISPVVQTQFGFHIIKLTDRMPESIQTFDDVKVQIENSLLTQKQSYAIDIFTAQLEAAADIEIFMVEKKEPEGTPVTELNKLREAEEIAEEPEVTGAAVADEAEKEKEEGYASLAECLTSKGARMYGSEESSTSEKQKELFGEDFSDVDYVDCSVQKEACKEAGVISYPTWVINGKKYPGKYSLERLAELSGCKA